MDSLVTGGVGRRWPAEETTLSVRRPCRPAPACGKLNAFVNEVNTKLQNGQLTVSEASQLLQAANAIKASLGC